jgi:hypothetical protein
MDIWIYSFENIHRALLEKPVCLLFVFERPCLIAQLVLSPQSFLNDW